MIRIIQPAAEQELRAARALIEEYMDSLAEKAHFDDREGELGGLPGRYAPPGGRLFLAVCDGLAGGCVGVRKLDERICEMKRFYVRPAFRGKGLGRKLAAAAVEQARAIGYNVMSLETLSSMTEARALYASLGFREVGRRPGDCGEPIVRMELVLSKALT